MTFVINDVENAIRNWCQVLTGVSFFHAMTNVARPAGDPPNGLYGTVRLIDATVQGIPSDQFEDVDISGEPFVDHSLMDKRVVTISINCCRTGARDALNTLQVAGYSDRSTQLLQQANIGFVKFSTLRDITDVINGNFEERGQLDATFNVVGADTETLYVIETVPIENETYDQDFEVTI